MKNISPLLLLSIALITSLPCCKKVQSESCSDQVKNQDETSIDCGGSCSPCPTCSDGFQNQDETGIDCGGECIPCGTITYIVSGTYSGWSGNTSFSDTVAPTPLTTVKNGSSVHLEFRDWKIDYDYENEDDSTYYYKFNNHYNAFSSLSIGKTNDSIFVDIDVYPSSHSANGYSLHGVKNN
ncbi:MAG TPA: hypothetical protein VK154_04310 [Chitinophagales bacterium]|nr:hypothetical protein [Chitinophagales bacterium]